MRRMVSWAYSVDNMVEIIFSILILVVSVVIHEVSHGYAASLLGDPTARLAGRLTLNPLKHLDPVGSFLVPAALVLLNAGLVFGWAKPVPYNPYQLRGGRWGPALVAAAGPAANLILALVFALLWRAGVFATLVPAAAGLVMSIVLINIMLALFNLLPVPPLDGSKILFAILPYQLRGLEEWFARHQLIVLIIFIMLIANTDFLGRWAFALFHLFVGA